ncbi:hypothetical protein UNDKW_0427 [Undibacterium sp. KW1]|nr:hypothetical protein UNDKW_0427 [Undibacterium sp. KW1]
MLALTSAIHAELKGAHPMYCLAASRKGRQLSKMSGYLCSMFSHLMSENLEFRALCNHSEMLTAAE